jgi:hypothetical protein
MGDTDGQTSFCVSPNPNWGMLKSVSEKVPQPPAFVDVAQVRIARLDTLVATGEVPAPDVMKVDIEGGEVGMLKGAEETLRTKRPVLLVDLHGTNAAVEEALARAGYLARIIGGGKQALTDALWNASVVAIPKEREDLAGALEEMAAPDRGSH